MITSSDIAAAKVRFENASLKLSVAWAALGALKAHKKVAIDVLIAKGESPQRALLGFDSYYSEQWASCGPLKEEMDRLENELSDLRAKYEEQNQKPHP